MKTQNVAIISIVVLEALALLQGIDGVLLSSGIAIIAGIAGYQIHATKKKNQ